MFFLGSAFILLELQSIAHLSLLYGSTWLTSSVVINSVLIMILIANVLVIKFGNKYKSHQACQPVLYGLLLLALVLSFLLPVHTLQNALGVYLGNTIVTIGTILPMLMAGVIFAIAFSQAKEPHLAFAFNLLGAVV